MCVGEVTITARNSPLDVHDLEYLEGKIGYSFKNRELLQRAFTRDTYSNEKGGNNNQVLEFIGDTALSMVVVRGMADMIVKAEKEDMPLKVSEGILTVKRVGLVNDVYLAKTARKLKIQTYQVVGGNYANRDQWDADKPCSSLIEAILGAVAVDSNWSIMALRKVCNKLFGEAWLSKVLDDCR